MSQRQEIWIDPTEQELVTALADYFGLSRLLDVDWPRTVFALPEGVLTWDTDEVGSLEESQRAWLAWWSDFTGRRHVRINVYLPPGADVSPTSLDLVYPDYCFWVGDAETEREAAKLLVFCPCGVVGTPAEIGWMGTECGPCHDRREAGHPAEQPWLLPQYSCGSHNTFPVPVISPDGTLLADIHERGGLTLWNLTTGKHRHSSVCGDGVIFAPEGNSLLCYSGTADAIEIRRITSRSLGRPTALAAPPLGHLEFSPDGRWLLGVGAFEERTWVWSWPDRTRVLALTRTPAFAWPSLGSTGLFHRVSRVGTILETHVLGVSEIPVQHQPIRRSEPLTCHATVPTADGSGLILGTDTGQVARLDLQTTTVTSVVRLESTGPMWPHLTPEGDLLVTSPSQTYLLDAATLEVRARLWFHRAAPSYAVACGSRWLVVAEERGNRLLPWPGLRQQFVAEQRL